MYLILFDTRQKKYLVEVNGEMQRVPGLGIVDTSVLAKYRAGQTVELFGEKYLLLHPEPQDYIELIKRKTQIILPKDTGYIVTKCGIFPGKRVCEIGMGVGGLTIFLAAFVGPDGKVYAYERRKEHIEEAKRNLAILGLDNVVECFERDASEGIAQKDLDAVICDIPNPWEIMGEIRKALKAGAWCACYLPTYNQVEKTVLCMSKEGFSEVECVEILLRKIEVAENAVRPAFSMLSHTGFIVTGRKMDG